MSDFHSDDLLSAFLDGELSGAERAEIESRLARSPEARGDLAELRQVSELVRGLPRVEAPADFSAEVMHLAERRMLLAESAAAALSATRARPGHHPLRWVLAIGAPLATAAVLLVIVRLAERPPAQPGRLAKDAAPGGDHVAQDDGFARFKGARFEARDVERPLPAPAAPAERPLVVDAEERVAPPMPAPGAMVRAGSSDRADRAVQDLLRLDTGEKIPVVTMYVVDQADSMQLVQYVLENNDIQADAVGIAAADAQSRRPGGEKIDGVGAREGFYVVAETAHLVAAFEAALEQKDKILDLEVDEPVELAALESTSQKQVQKLLDEFARGRGTSSAADRADTSDAAKAAARTAPSKATRPAQRTRSSSPARGQGGETAQESVDEAPAGRQLRVLVSERAVRRDGSEKRDGVPKAQAPREAPARSDEAPASAEKVSDAEPPAAQAPPSLVRVLILLERKNEAPPAPAKARGDGAA